MCFPKRYKAEEMVSIFANNEQTTQYFSQQQYNNAVGQSVLQKANIILEIIEKTISKIQTNIELLDELKTEYLKFSDFRHMSKLMTSNRKLFEAKFVMSELIDISQQMKDYETKFEIIMTQFRVICDQKLLTLFLKKYQIESQMDEGSDDTFIHTINELIDEWQILGREDIKHFDDFRKAAQQFDAYRDLLWSQFKSYVQNKFNTHSIS